MYPAYIFVALIVTATLLYLMHVQFYNNTFPITFAKLCSVGKMKISCKIMQISASGQKQILAATIVVFLFEKAYLGKNNYFANIGEFSEHVRQHK